MGPLNRLAVVLIVLVCGSYVAGLMFVQPKKGQRTCEYCNDPHYVSFDETNFDYHATCKHILTKPCGGKWNPKYPRFEVSGQNNKCPYSHGRWHPTCIGSISLRFTNLKGPDVEFGITDQMTVTIDGLPLNGPPPPPEFIPTIDGLPLNGPPPPPEFIPTIDGLPLNGPPPPPEFIPTIDGLPLNGLPFTYRGPGFSVDIHADARNPNYIVMETNFGLQIRRERCIKITLADELATDLEGKLCGICGQHNYVKGDDDFTLPDGRNFPRIYKRSGIAKLLSQVYSEFYVPNVNDPPGCSVNGDGMMPASLRSKRQLGPSGGFEGGLTPSRQEGNRPQNEDQLGAACNPAALRRTKAACGVINAPNGPFAKCYKNTDDRKSWYESCIDDICLDTGFLCDILGGYADICGKAGPTGDWRTEAKCPFECGRNEVYTTAAHPLCVPTCFDPTPCLTRSNDTVITPPENDGFSDGCVCERGYVHNGRACVSKRTCRPEKEILAKVDVNQKACAAKQGAAKVECLASGNMVVNLTPERQRDLLAIGGVTQLDTDPCFDQTDQWNKAACKMEADRKSQLCPGLFGAQKAKCLKHMVEQKLTSN